MAHGCWPVRLARKVASTIRPPGMPLITPVDARDRGEKIEVFDQQERLFRSIVIEPAELADSGFVLPSI